MILLHYHICVMKLLAHWELYSANNLDLCSKTMVPCTWCQSKESLVPSEMTAMFFGSALYKVR